MGFEDDLHRWGASRGMVPGTGEADEGIDPAVVVGQVAIDGSSPVAVRVAQWRRRRGSDPDGPTTRGVRDHTTLVRLAWTSSGCPRFVAAKHDGATFVTRDGAASAPVAAALATASSWPAFGGDAEGTSVTVLERDVLIKCDRVVEEPEALDALVALGAAVLTALAADWHALAASVANGATAAAMAAQVAPPAAPRPKGPPLAVIAVAFVVVSAVAAFVAQRADQHPALGLIAGAVVAVSMLGIRRTAGMSQVGLGISSEVAAGWTSARGLHLADPELAVVHLWPWSGGGHVALAAYGRLPGWPTVGYVLSTQGRVPRVEGLTVTFPGWDHVVVPVPEGWQRPGAEVTGGCLVVTSARDHGVLPGAADLDALVARASQLLA